MLSVAFTSNLRRHVNVAGVSVEAATVRAALERVFDDHPELRSFLLDDQGAVRRHVTIFLNGEPITDRERQSDPVAPGDEVYVAQALSGG